MVSATGNEKIYKIIWFGNLSYKYHSVNINKIFGYKMYWAESGYGNLLRFIVEMVFSETGCSNASIWKLINLLSVFSGNSDGVSWRSFLQQQVGSITFALSLALCFVCCWIYVVCNFMITVTFQGHSYFLSAFNYLLTGARCKLVFTLNPKSWRNLSNRIGI